MMKLFSPKKLFDFDSFLPSDGETRFEIFYSDGDLNIDIFYEIGDEIEEAKKNIRFLKTKHFFKSPFPGYSFFTCPDDRDMSLLNSLVEYEHSDMLDVERSIPGATNFKHYRFFLHSTGVAIHVIAKSCEISDEK